MKALKAALVITLAVLFSISCGTTPTTNQNQNRAAAPALSPSPADAKPADQSQATATINGAALFNEQARPKCSTCHGENGKGVTKGSPDFTSVEWQKKESDAELIEAIKKGKKSQPTPMPPYEGKLSDEEIKALVAHVRSFAK